MTRASIGSFAVCVLLSLGATAAMAGAPLWLLALGLVAAGTAGVLVWRGARVSTDMGSGPVAAGDADPAKDPSRG